MASTHRKTTDKDVVALAGEIRKVRAQLNLDQGRFAHLVGVSQQTISDWKHGKRLNQIIVSLRLVRFLDKQAVNSEPRRERSPLAPHGVDVTPLHLISLWQCARANST